MSSKSYEELRDAVIKLQNEGKLSRSPSREQRIDWAYGTTVIENENVTRAMVEQAADRAHD